MYHHNTNALPPPPPFKVGVLGPAQQPGSYWVRPQPLSLVGVQIIVMYSS